MITVINSLDFLWNLLLPFLFGIPSCLPGRHDNREREGFGSGFGLGLRSGVCLAVGGWHFSEKKRKEK